MHDLRNVAHDVRFIRKNRWCDLTVGSYVIIRLHHRLAMNCITRDRNGWIIVREMIPLTATYEFLTLMLFIHCHCSVEDELVFSHGVFDALLRHLHRCVHVRCLHSRLGCELVLFYR